MTTRFKIIGAFAALLLAATFLITPNAEARAPLAREAQAIVQTINHDKRTLTLYYQQGRGPSELVWNSQTQFLREREFVLATELKEGTHATVYYHSPFFGKPFITKMVWINGK